MPVLSRPRSGMTFFHPAHLIAVWFGAGLLPKAPGTWGSAAALPLAWLISQQWGSYGLIAATAACTMIGWWACAVYVRKTGVEDPKEVVVDEVAGQWLALCPAPLDPWMYLIGFILFRTFDISKPWPAGWADRTIGGGGGIMLDDMLAAAYAAAIMAAISFAWSMT